MVRTVRNPLGAERYIHRLARTSPPTLVPALPGSGISGSDDWATEALSYDHALRTIYHRPEGRTVPTTAGYDGFGLSVLNGATRSVVIHADPAGRTRTATTTLIAEGAGATAQSWKETLLFDGAGNTTKRTVVDLGNGVEQVWQTAFDAIGQTLEGTAPTGRSTKFDYDVAGRIIRRD
jgi:YD repeat-containing protein